MTTSIGEICKPLREVIYITDMMVINMVLAGKLVKKIPKLEDRSLASIMVRASK